MERFVAETTLHGVKDAWQANWLGRVFWLALLIGSIIAVSFQLKGLVSEYTKHEVGTRTLPWSHVGTVPLPAVFLCSYSWYPQTSESDSWFQEIMDLIFPLSLADRDEMMENSVVTNPMPKFAPARIASTQEQVSKMLEQFNGLPSEYLKHLLMEIEKKDELRVIFEAHGETKQQQDRLTNVSMAVTLNGVCFELTTSVDKLSFNEPWRLSNSFMVNHDGEARYKKANQANNGRSRMKVTKIIIAQQNSPHLYFHDVLHINQYSDEAVELTVIPVKQTRLNRKGNRCRKDWTALDQAHCHQRLLLEKNGTLCETCLPGSRFYPEIRVTNRTCLYKRYRLHLFEDEDRYRKSSLEQVASSLQVPSRGCPLPCDTMTFGVTMQAKRASYRDSTSCGILYHGMSKFSGEMKNATSYENVFGKTPCAVVYLNMKPEFGSILEEYLLITTEDLLANVGGTLGLWLGASAISFAQMIYLLCLLPFMEANLRRARTGETLSFI